MHAGIPPPQKQTPLEADIPREVDPPKADTPMEADPPKQTPPKSRPLPCAVHAGRYGQQAGGMHPTGMQSC